jgi:hypothetical protein
METRIPNRNVWEDSLPEAQKRREILEQARQTIERAQSLLASLDQGQLPLGGFRQTGPTPAQPVASL